MLFQEHGELHRFLQGAARVARHKIRHQILLLAAFLCCGIEPLLKLLIDLDMRLAHEIQHLVAGVLRRHLELTAHVILHKLVQKIVVLVLEHIVEPDTGTYEYLFDPLYGPQSAQKMYIVAVVGYEVLAGSGRQALLPLAHAVLLLLLAGGVTEVRRRSADIVDITLEPWIFRELHCFLVYAVLASGLDPAPLMERYRTEVAEAEAPTVMRDGKLDLLYRRNAALLFVHRVVHTHVRELVGVVELRLGNTALGRVLHQHFITMALYYRPAIDLVLLVILLTAGLGIGFLVRADYLEAVALDCADRSILRLGKIAGTPQVVHVFQVQTRLEVVQHLGQRDFSHAVHEVIRPGAHQNGRHHTVVPVVIVCKSPQGGFKTAYRDLNVRVKALEVLTVDSQRTVRASAAPAAGGICVVVALLEGNGVVRHHAVDVSARHHEAVLRSAELHVIRITERLSDNSYSEPRRFYHA